MKNEKPLILISNDDGVEAKGLHELVRGVREIGEVVVMAPDGLRSGSSVAITSESPVRYRLIKREPGLTVYSCTGTPVDCVKLAFHTVLPRRPDVVLGGINHGDNSSINVHYSGTMGVVTEACLRGVPSVGYSLCDYRSDADFTPTLPYVRHFTELILAKGLPMGVCLNVNFPMLSAYRGVRVCRQTYGRWVNEWKSCIHPRGGEYFWLTGSYENLEPGVEGSDQWALEQGYVAVTPTQMDVTAYGMMAELNDWDWSV